MPIPAMGKAESPDGVAKRTCHVATIYAPESLSMQRKARCPLSHESANASKHLKANGMRLDFAAFQ